MTSGNADWDAATTVVVGSIRDEHTLLYVRGQALGTAALHYRENPPSDERLLSVLVTADAAAYERFLLTGRVAVTPPRPPVGQVYQRVAEVERS